MILSYQPCAITGLIISFITYTGLLDGGENTGRFDYNVGTDLAPWNILRVTFLEHLDFLSCKYIYGNEQS